MGCTASGQLDIESEKANQRPIRKINNENENSIMNVKNCSKNNNQKDLISEDDKISKLQDIINKEKEEENLIKNIIEKNQYIDKINVITNKKFILKIIKGSDNISNLKLNEKNILCLESLNPFKENLDNDKIINILKTELKKYNVSDTCNNDLLLNEYCLCQNQKIYNKYNLVFKLMNIFTKEYEVFDFNKINKPILILFFDILSIDALLKIKEIKEIEKQYIENENKNFIFLPIMNIYIKDDLSIISNYLTNIEEQNIKENCYILSEEFNKSFIHLFSLDTITQSKLVIINRNSEISLIINDSIEYITTEIIDYYLNKRKSEIANEKEYYEEADKNKIKNMLMNNDFKSLFNKFKKDYRIEFDFNEIGEYKNPINIKIKFNQKDKNIKNKFIENLNKEFNNTKNEINIKYFLSEYEIKDKKNELLKAFQYLKEQLFKNNENDQIYINNIKNSCFSLNCNNMVSLSNNNNAPFSKNKKYLIKFILNNNILFNNVLQTFSSCLYTNPAFANLSCGHCIDPAPQINFKMKIENCKNIILYKKMKDQLKFNMSNEEITYNLKEKGIELIFLLNPNILINNNYNIEYVKNLLDFFILNNINFVICVFSFNELDCQKLRYLNYDKIYDEEICKIIYINMGDIESYKSFNFYCEDITMKIFHLDLSNETLKNYYDLDEYRSYNDFINDFNKNDKTETNNMKAIDESEYQKIKKYIYDFIKSQDYLNIFSTNYISVININLIYDWQLTFPENSFENYNKFHRNMCIYLGHLDYIKNKIDFGKCIKNINQLNNNILFKETCIKTINLYEQIKNKKQHFICNKCLQQKNLISNNFYTCYECKSEDFFMCNDCYIDLYNKAKNIQSEEEFFSGFIMQKKDDNNVNKSNDSNFFYKKIHEHPLLSFINYNPKKESYIIEDTYKKYMSKENRKKLKEIKECIICNNYIYNDVKNLNILLSHIKKQKEVNNKLYEEVFICENCFEENKYINFLEKELTDNNFIFLKIQY